MSSRSSAATGGAVWPFGTSRSTLFKRIAWLSIVLIALYFYLDNVPRYFAVSAKNYGRYWPYHNWLFLHIMGGSLALLLGPWQFWTSFRNRHLRVHRWIGRFYLSGVLLGSIAGFYMPFVSKAGWTFGVGLFTLSFVWLSTAIMAFVSIRNRRIEAHKEWMIRSYVVTFAFAGFRLLDDSGIIADVGTRTEQITTLGWASWVVPLFIAEVALRWKESMRKVRRKEMNPAEAMK